MGIFLNAASVIGPAHIKASLPNQDAVIVRSKKGYWLAVVCDGMGSRRHSDVGSQCATKSVFHAVNKHSFGVNDRELVETIYLTWLSELKKKSIKPAEAVTTCLFAWGQCDGRFRFAHLGDGMIASASNVLSVGKDSHFGSETTGLGLSTRLSDWSFGKGLLSEHGDCLALMTDGISEDLSEPTKFCVELNVELTKRSFRLGKRWLQNQLRNWPTKGHSDDKTLALIRKKDVD
ncbi:PP2C family serine/threonine-protein phosphatase [Vibrio parahaemolyticus]|uniref:PP2C family serine/threonine-protein phosphatase n=1 Tax=Vibrio parahaemolyticus TaxID=670 RepID=UPI00041AA43A|nr:PP2C family serine/threonine-protein phosphatase [Vibrio parahaemolyticus]EIV1705655.1 protein phosphatase 2C domain-containing protein [Vibrio parahaemolyticus]EJE4689129.1 protein phosphatase 2C domain-containing protein [Vibrio parahaemolyticus]EJE4703526.1 protein phosphatase 2C domain-containing protein [Vibrio parahaemolyticus]EJG1634269.1 protein phosphatase 2C domain-containing protein [Vibrio parahaemolyticus]EJK2424523.1 protein phosphatase 2C domain-containing protein [Vibrio par